MRSKPAVGEALALEPFLENMLRSRISRRVLAEQHINIANSRWARQRRDPRAYRKAAARAGPLPPSAAADAAGGNRSQAPTVPPRPPANAAAAPTTLASSAQSWGSRTPSTLLPRACGRCLRSRRACALEAATRAASSTTQSALCVVPWIPALGKQYGLLAHHTCLSPTFAKACTESYGAAPEVIVTGDLRLTMPYIPAHLGQHQSTGAEGLGQLQHVPLTARPAPLHSLADARAWLTCAPPLQTTCCLSCSKTRLARWWSRPWASRQRAVPAAVAAGCSC